MTNIHPYCFVRLPCVSLGYCCKIWTKYKLIGDEIYTSLQEKFKKIFRKNIELKYVYVPIFGDWSKMEQLLSKLSSDRYCGGESQYSLSWIYVMNTFFRDKILGDIPEPSPSEFHELSFDVLKTIGCSKMAHQTNFVKIDPSIHSKVNIHSLNSKMEYLKKFINTENEGLNEIPESLKSIEHPEISIDIDEITSFLSTRSAFMTHFKYLDNIEELKQTILVIKKSHNISSFFGNENKNQLDCIYWDVPFRLKISHKLSKPSDSILIYKNIWNVNQQLFSFYNAFLRDYCFHEEENDNGTKVYCKTDQANNPKNDYMTSVDSRLGFRGSVNVNGMLLLEHLVSDHHLNRRKVSQYDTEKLSKNINFLGIGVHSIHFDMNIVSEQYTDKSSCPFGLSRNDNEGNFTISGKNEQLQDNPYWKSNILSQKSTQKYKKNNGPKPPFYFSVLWLLDNVVELKGVNSIHLIVKDNRNQHFYNDYCNNNSENGFENENSNSSWNLNESSQNVKMKDEYINSSNIKDLKSFFCKYTSLSGEYFMYLIRRLLPFVTEEKENGLFSLPIKVTFMKKSINSWVSKIEDMLDEMLPYGVDGDLRKRLYKMPFIYNDSRNYFKNNCKVLYNMLKKDKYRKDLFCGCFSLDKNLVNFGMIKTINTNTTDIYIDYDYENLLKDCRDVVFIALEICKICRSDVQEILMGSKMTWFSRLCEYLCGINSYPKPNILCNVKTITNQKYNNSSRSSSSSSSASFLSNQSKFVLTQTEVENLESDQETCTEQLQKYLEDIKKSEVDNWKLKGGDISTSLNGCHLINDDYSFSEKRYNAFIGIVDFDAFYNSIICEYQLGYICYNPYTINNDKMFYMSSELLETFKYLVNTRRELKAIKNRSESINFRLNALKRVGNSFFGCAGMDSSPVRSKILSNLITYIGRLSIITSRQLSSKIDTSYILMSHTDSLCLKIVKREISPLYKQNGYFIDDDFQDPFRSVEKYLEDVNSVLGTNGFIKLLSENIYNCVHVINRTHYIAQKKQVSNTNDYEKWISDVFHKLESHINTKNTNEVDIWSNILCCQKELKKILKDVFFDRFEREFTVKGIFTKRWSLLKRFFFSILVISKICDKSLHMGYNTKTKNIYDLKSDDENENEKLFNNFTSFMIFRIRNLIFRSIKTKNVLILSGFVDTIDGVIQKGFSKLFEKRESRFCVLRTDELISDILLSLKKSKIIIGDPWNSEKYNVMTKIGLICKSGWILDNYIPNTEDLLCSDETSDEMDNDFNGEKTKEESIKEKNSGNEKNWYYSLFLDQIISDMNYENNFCQSEFDIRMPTDSEEFTDCKFVMLFSSTKIIIDDLIHFVKFSKAVSGINFKKEIDESRITVDKTEKTLSVNINTCKIGKYIFVHDIIFKFGQKMLDTIINHKTKNEEQKLSVIMDKFEKYYEHIITHFWIKDVFYGKYTSLHGNIIKSNLFVTTNNVLNTIFQILTESEPQ